jgi:hypothetical protein
LTCEAKQQTEDDEETDWRLRYGRGGEFLKELHPREQAKMDYGK